MRPKTYTQIINDKMVEVPVILNYDRLFWPSEVIHAYESQDGDVFANCDDAITSGVNSAGYLADWLERHGIIKCTTH